MESKANQSHSSLQTLDFLPFLLPFSLKNEMAHIMSPKTTFLVFISLKSIRPCLAFNPFKCKAMFGLHTHSYSSFSPFWSLILYFHKALFGL